MRLSSIAFVTAATFIAAPAFAASAVAGYFDRAPLPTDASRSATCAADAEKLQATLEQAAMQSANDAQAAAGEMDDLENMTPAISEALGAINSPDNLGCVSLLPSQMAQKMAPLAEKLTSQVGLLVQQRDAYCVAHPGADGSCDMSAVNRVFMPKVEAAGNAFYAALGTAIAPLRANLMTCVARREALVDKLVASKGVVKLQGVSARGADLAVAGAYAQVVHDACQAVEDSKTQFRE